MKHLPFIGLVSATALFGAQAFAHVELIDPPPRLPGPPGGNQLKEGPCGQDDNARTDTVTTYAPGETIQVQIREYTDHTGYIAVAFDPDGDDNFPFRADMDDVNEDDDDPEAIHPVGVPQDGGAVVLGYWYDADNNCAEQPNGTCTIEVTLPNTPCDNCTLQVIQFMYDKLGNGNDDEYYYQCADLVLEGEPVGQGGTGGMGGMAGSGGTTGGTGGTPAGTGGMEPVAGTGGSATTAGTGGAPVGVGGTPAMGGTPGAAGTTAPPPAAPTSSGGCSVNGGRATSAGAVLPLLALLLLRRRRRSLG